MPCLLWDETSSEQGLDEHFCHPFMPCSRIIPDDDAVLRCPCPGGCDGVMIEDGRNVMGTLTFYECDRCHHAAVVYDLDIDLKENP